MSGSALGGFRCAGCAMRSGRVPGASLGERWDEGKKSKEHTCAVRSHASSAAVAPPGPERAVGSGRGSPPDSSSSTDTFGMDRFFGNVGVDANKASKLRFGKDSSPSAVKRGHMLKSSSSSSDSASSTGRGHAAMVISSIPPASSSFRAPDPISVRRPVRTARAPCDPTPRGASSTNRARAWNKRSEGL